MDRFQILKGLPPPEKKPLPEGCNKELKTNRYVSPGVYIGPIYRESIPNRNERVYPSFELDYNYIEQRIVASLGITLKEEAQRYLNGETV